MDGYDKVINDLKKDSKLSATEGKSTLTKLGYALLAKMMLTFKPTDKRAGGSWHASIFGFAFLIFMWNLISRSDSIATLMTEHITFNEDCFIISEQGGKADQEGANKIDKHVYCNPMQPEICPGVALALLVLAPTEATTLSCFKVRTRKTSFPTR